MLQESQFRQLQSESMRHVREVDLTHKRYLYSQINWDARLIGIRGARGTGKTTMLLQYIKEHYADLSKVLYVTLDSFSFQLITLYDVAEYAYTHGIDALFVDEVHYMLQWGQQIKRIFDSFADLKIVYTGSSMLQIDEAQTDLSRRQTVYDLHGFSFREYLLFKGIYRHDAISLEDVLNNHTSLEMEQMLREGKIVNTIGDMPRRIAFLQCVGSRDEKVGNHYCSKLCCVTAVKQAIEVKKLIPQCEVYVFYMDLRMWGQHFEELYRQAQTDYNIKFIRGRISEAGGTFDRRVQIKAEDTLMGRPMKLTVDLFVLMVGMEASQGTRSLAAQAGIAGEYGFAQACDPHTSDNCTARDGLFVAGSCKRPMTLTDTLADARSAAWEVLRYLHSGLK